MPAGPPPLTPSGSRAPHAPPKPGGFLAQRAGSRPQRFEEWHIELYGRRLSYRLAGEGPPLVLIHGLLNSSTHWQAVAERLARRHLVIAPDLIGHGGSEAPRSDYSLGAHAASIRDVLAAIGVQRASIVGHSLGGGVAMQFFYQFPARVERLALISSGGLGPEVSALLRAAALPGSGALLAAISHRRALDALDRGGAVLRARGSRRAGARLRATARALRPIAQAGARSAFLHTLRAVIDGRGQRISAGERLGLLREIPTLIVWGERDRMIPLAHGRATHQAIPGSKLRTLARAGHFPHLEDPDGLARVLGEFLEQTPPGLIEDHAWGAAVARHGTPPRRAAD